MIRFIIDTQFWFYCGILLIQFLAETNAIPVDNSLADTPEVQCGSTGITVTITTRNPFEGHIYVKGLWEDEGCRVSSKETISLPFDGCNVRRLRSLEPSGIFISVTLIVQFHPKFVTKVDRAIRFQCFYMAADKTVSQDLEVSPLTTEFRTAVLPMPTCRYDILNAPNGSPVKFVVVGQPVYHKWTCDTNAQDTFCMTVHDCIVDDGLGTKVDILDEQGCAIDKYILRNLEYVTDLMAGQETHVFKFADTSQLFFQCQISIVVKESEECSLPQCPTLKRKKRQESTKSVLESVKQTSTAAATVDVIRQINALDLSESTDERPSLPSFNTKDDDSPQLQKMKFDSKNVQYCISTLGIAIVASSIGITFLITCFVVLIFLTRPNKI